MKKIWFIALLSTLLSSVSMAKKITISGQIVDQNTQTPLDYATISILDTHTKSLVGGTTSDTEGKFSIKIEEGEYDIKVSYLSFNDYLLSTQKIMTDRDFGTIELVATTSQLKTVEVRAERTTVEFKLDKKVFNVGKDLTSKGGAVTDVLDNVPSVSVSPSGEVSLRGNSNVRILINGKPSVLTANNGLEQIPSEMIERVEVVTNPSARYEASGTAGIINIVLKKKKGHGFGGSLQLTTGYPADHRANLNVNYKTDKFNLFSNIGYRYSNFFGEGEREVTQWNETEKLQSLQNKKQERNDDAYNVYLGADYYINDKNTITTSFYHNKVVNTDVYTDDYIYLLNGQLTDSTFHQVEKYLEPQNFNQLEIDYVKTFDTKGRKFTTNVQYDFWNDDENENINRTSFINNELVVNESLVTRDIESSKDLLVQTDFTTPVGEKGSFEVGGRAEIRRITSDYTAVLNDEALEEYDNVLIYDERIYGAYIQYGQKYKRFSYLLGLRTELSDIGIADDEDIYKNDKDYINLFPTAHFTYNLNETTNVQLSYSRRINRPGFWQLNAFGGLSDPVNRFAGNPDLNPSYTNAYELGLMKRWEKVMLNPAVYYQHNTDYFEFYTTSDGQGNYVTTPINLSHENRIGAEVSMTYSPFKWMRLGSEFNYYFFEQFGEYQKVNFATQNDTWTARARMQMRLPKSIAAQLMYRYEAGNQSGQTYRAERHALGFSISKDFNKDKMSITLNARNLLDSRIDHRITKGINYTIDDTSKRIGRRISATFIYRFNRNKNQRDRMPD